MTRVASGNGKRAATIVALVLVLLAGVFFAADKFGWPNVMGLSTKDTNTQVINAITRTQEVSLLSLGIMGLAEEERNSTVLGMGVPGSGEKVLLQYQFDAKLGIDGSKVSIDKTSAKSYLISIPAFAFIGYSNPTFKVADTDGGILSWVTRDIDQVEMVNKILNDNARQKYLDSNETILEDQAKAFYDGIISGIDPSITTTYQFQAKEAHQ